MLKFRTFYVIECDHCGRAAGPACSRMTEAILQAHEVRWVNYAEAAHLCRECADYRAAKDAAEAVRCGGNGNGI